jgi:hypothetical protein
MANTRHCNQCGRNKPGSHFAGYDRIPTNVRVEHAIEKIYICNECLNEPHRPRAIREAAGLVQPRRKRAVEVEHIAPGTGLSAKAKRAHAHTSPAWMQTIIPELRPQPRRKGVQHMTNAASPPIVDANASESQYPNVLPPGSTFIPVGFEKGPETGLIIRLDASDPLIPVEAPCFNCSQIEGRQVYHPHWEFFRDRSRVRHIRGSCRKTHRYGPEKRDKIASTARQEREMQIAEGRRMSLEEEDQLRDAVEAAVNQQPLVDMVILDDVTATVSATIPLQVDIPHDLRVLMPEGWQAFFSNQPYLDFKSDPIGITELHRVGLWLITQLHEALVSHAKWRQLGKEYDELHAKYDALVKEGRGTGAYVSELEAQLAERESKMERQIGSLEAKLHQAVDDLARKDQELAQERELHAVDLDMLRLTDESNNNLAGLLKKAEELLRPLLGGRSLAEALDK